MKVRLLVALLAGVAEVAACSIVYEVVPVGTSFQVAVKDRNRPVGGLRLVLQGGRVAQTVATGDGATAPAAVPPAPEPAKAAS